MDEQLKRALIALLNSDLIKVAGNKFTKQDLIDWVEKQKPTENSDFKVRLADYMQKASQKDGRYVLSSESILKMAEEELLKRGVVQKPAELPAGFYYVDEDGKKYYSKEFRAGAMRFMVPDEQKQTERIEEDEAVINRACVALRAYANGDLPEILPSELFEIADKLNSLRPQPKWKPSEVQMQVLGRLIKFAGGNAVFCLDNIPIADSLYTDLKKLKEE